MSELLKFSRSCLTSRQRTSRKRKSNLRNERLIAQVQLRIIRLLVRLDPEIGRAILIMAASKKCRKRRNGRLKTHQSAPHKNPATVIDIGHWAGKQA